MLQEATCQNVSIKLDRQALYKYAPNPIKIMVENIACTNVVVKAKHGKIISNNYENDSCSYIYWCSNCDIKYDQIIIGVKSENNIKWIDTLEYQLSENARKNIYVTYLGCRDTCLIDKEKFNLELQFLTESGGDTLFIHHLTAPLTNWDIDLNYKVIKYSVEISRQNKIIFMEKDIAKDYFSNSILSKLSEIQTGDKLRFFDVYVNTGSCDEKFSGPMLIVK
jgi:hypothetical protein